MKRKYTKGNFNENSLKNLEQRKKPVIWNGERFESGSDLMRYLSVGDSAVCKSIKQGSRLKGHYVDYAL